MRSHSYFGVISVFILLVISEAEAWHNIEHAIIAKIAENYANKQSMEKVRTIAELIGPQYPSTASYLDSACWADEIKKQSEFNYTASWHYIRTPYYRDGISGREDTTEENVIMKLKSLIKDINQNAVTMDESMKLRYFIHLVGDIHQPLHNIELYDNKFPTGDTNGQQFMIQLEDKENNTITQKLHVLTDAAGGLCSDTPTLPFTDERFDEINNKAKEFASACDDLYFQGFEFDPYQWSKESYEKGKSIYDSVNVMSILTDEQMEYIQGILKTQICKAGKRLAMSYELIYNQFPIPADFYFIMIGFLSLLAIVVLDEVYHGGSCSKQRKEYLGIENNKKKVRFD
ncbi:hypothetical protein WA171_004305, partial [Blastocystis sp. BT1]